ncbi:hypothetical protein DVH24_039696 [Malus domestica]|uniref:Uncharacterized protein n=1 Tax=Malus domestica TaxID=3750 RepID=A0A498I6M0_MALDO|nr:hypothetical protein DVH24_039696 [Malus domestica]
MVTSVKEKERARERETKTERGRESDFRDLQIISFHTEALQISRPQLLNTHLDSLHTTNQFLRL